MAKNYDVELTFTEALLGTAPLDKEIYTTYIAEKKADLASDDLNDEVDTLNEDKGVTGFHTDPDGHPFLYNYMIRGFFKDACGMLRRSKETRSSKITAYKKIIDGLVFVYPRHIHLHMPKGLVTGILERPLRAQTPQGERVALSKSESAPIGTKIKFRIKVIDTKTIDLEQLEEWLDYGQDRGLGQWRNGGYGTFEYTIAEA